MIERINSNGNGNGAEAARFRVPTFILPAPVEGGFPDVRLLAIEEVDKQGHSVELTMDPNNPGVINAYTPFPTEIMIRESLRISGLGAFQPNGHSPEEFVLEARGRINDALAQLPQDPSMLADQFLAHQGR